jgi:hypothetical protein
MNMFGVPKYIVNTIVVITFGGPHISWWEGKICLLTAPDTSPIHRQLYLTMRAREASPVVLTPFASVLLHVSMTTTCGARLSSTMRDTTTMASCDWH